MSFDHRNYHHLELLEHQLRNLPERRLAVLNAYMAGEGLMRTNRFLEVVVACSALIQRTNRQAVWFQIYTKNPEISAGASDCLIHHLLRGRDRTDPQSAGGFSEPELFKLEMQLMRLGCFMPLPEAVQA